MDEVDHLGKANKDLVGVLEGKINSLDAKADEINGNVNANEKAIAALGDKMKDNVKDEIDNLGEKIEAKIAEVDEKCDTNDNHVENLRALNQKLIDQIKAQVTDDMDNQKELSEKNAEAIRNLEDKADEMQKEIIVHETIIKDTKETYEKNLKELNEKIFVIEKAQDDMDVQMIKETIDSLNDKYDKVQQDRGEIVNEIKIVDDRHQRGVQDVNSRLDNENAETRDQLRGLSKQTLLSHHIFLQLISWIKMLWYPSIIRSKGISVQRALLN